MTAMADLTRGKDGSNTSSGDSTVVVPAKTDASSGVLSALSSETVTYQGSGLVFNNTYGSNVSVTFRNEIVAAENYLQSLFSNACTVNCSFDLQPLNPALSAENQCSIVPVYYPRNLSSRHSAIAQTFVTMRDGHESRGFAGAPDG